MVLSLRLGLSESVSKIETSGGELPTSTSFYVRICAFIAAGNMVQEAVVQSTLSSSETYPIANSRNNNVSWVMAGRHYSRLTMPTELKLSCGHMIASCC